MWVTSVIAGGELFDTPYKGELVKSFCVKCDKQQEMLNVKDKYYPKVGKPGFEGICLICGRKLYRVGSEKEIKKDDIESQYSKIEEIKNTCMACKNVWFYGVNEKPKELSISDKLHNLSVSYENTAKTGLAITGFLPAFLLPDKEKRKAPENPDRSRCPKCGSKAIKTKKVVHKFKK